MHRAVIVCFLTLGVALGWVALVSAQSYQRYSDGLVAVNAKKVVEQPERVSFEVCARVTREAQACPVEIRLTFRGESGEVLAQAAPVLSPAFPRPVCTTVPLPAEASDMSRWEISRFRCSR